MRPAYCLPGASCDIVSVQTYLLWRRPKGFASLRRSVCPGTPPSDALQEQIHPEQSMQFISLQFLRDYAFSAFILCASPVNNEIALLRNRFAQIERFKRPGKRLFAAYSALYSRVESHGANLEAASLHGIQKRDIQNA